MIEMRVATAATLTVADSHGPVAVGIARDDWSAVEGEEQNFGGEVIVEVVVNVGWKETMMLMDGRGREDQRLEVNESLADQLAVGKVLVVERRICSDPDPARSLVVAAGRS